MAGNLKEEIKMENIGIKEEIQVEIIPCFSAHTKKLFQALPCHPQVQAYDSLYTDQAI